MRSFNHHVLRILVALLVTVFVANTVYAGGMMVSANANRVPVQLESDDQQTAHEAMVHHCHDQIVQNQIEPAHIVPDQPHSDQQYASHAPQSHSASHCHHCMACYSVILNSPLHVTSLRSHPVLATAVNELYLAPVNPQPSKPPII